jgi:hypothetical protein
MKNKQIFSVALIRGDFGNLRNLPKRAARTGGTRSMITLGGQYYGI